MCSGSPAPPASDLPQAVIPGRPAGKSLFLHVRPPGFGYGGTMCAVRWFTVRFATWGREMRSLLASGCIAIALLSAAPASAQLDVGSGLMGAGVGAAIGA